MFFSLSVYAVGCGGGDEGGDSADGTDNSSTDTGGDSSPGDSAFKVTPGVSVPTPTLTDDSTADGTPTADTPVLDGASKPFVAPSLDDIDIQLPTFKIDDPFAIPDDPIKKDGKGAANDG